MTVRQLITKLETFPDDMEVVTFDNEFGCIRQVENVTTQVFGSVVRALIVDNAYD